MSIQNVGEKEQNNGEMSVSPQDLLLTIGQLTVENGLLRARLRELEQQQTAEKEKV